MSEPPGFDYGKFRWAQGKKERGGSSNSHSTLKELRVRPAIDLEDLSYRVVQGRRFLEQGYKVQVVCIFRGRQLEQPELGQKVISSVAEQLADIAQVETHPVMAGNRLRMILAPKA